MLTALQAPNEALDKSEQNFVANVREHGWFRTDIFEEEGHPGFSYSTGVSCASRNSLCTKTVAHDIFTCSRGKTVWTPATIAISRNAQGYVFPVARKFYADHLGWSRWFYAGDDFPCLQIVWPDREGLFPWEDGFDQTFKGKQIDLTEHGWRASILD
jgi:hypothetical protein